MIICDRCEQPITDNSGGGKVNLVAIPHPFPTDKSPLTNLAPLGDLCAKCQREIKTVVESWRAKYDAEKARKS